MTLQLPTKLKLLGLCALLGLAACKKASTADMQTPDSYDYDAGSMGAADYGGYAGDDESLVVTESEAMPEPAMDAPAPRERQRLFDRRDKSAARREVASPAPAQPTTTPPQDAAATSGSAEPDKAIEQRDPEVDARHIVYTAQMTVAVFNLEDSLHKAESLPDQYGGYISNMTENQLVLRIPSKNLRKVMAELGEYGNVEHRTLRAMDVTAEFTDIESRIKALEETQKQLLELLSKSRNVQEALQVRQALDNITTQLEVLKGRMRQLSNQISFSTLTVNLYERGPHTPVPSSNDPFPWVNDLGVESTEWK
jgi:hypothetical protein